MAIELQGNHSLPDKFTTFEGELQYYMEMSGKALSDKAEGRPSTSGN